MCDKPEVIIHEAPAPLFKSRALDIHMDSSGIGPIWRKFLFHLFSTDIWVNNIPVLRTLILANILVWIIMWWSL